MNSILQEQAHTLICSECRQGGLKVKCCFCKGALGKTRTKIIADLGECVVIVKNVPAMVCKQCGEKSFDDATMERLEKIVAAVRNSLVREVAIVEYTDKVA